MPTARWRSIADNPTTSLEWAVFYPLLNSVKEGQARVDRQENTATPASPALVARPGTAGKFLPPILVDNKQQIEDRLMLRAKRTWRVLLFGSIVFLLFYSVEGAYELIPIWLAMTTPVVAYHFWNYRRLCEDAELIKELWLFTSWVYLQTTWKNYSLAVLICFFGALQLFSQQYLGSSASIPEVFGTTYEGIEEKEYWRFITGPLLHLSLAHWLINMILSIGIWFLAVAVFGLRTSLIVLCLSGVGSFVATYWIDFVLLQSETDGIVGISGGLGGLLGLLLASSVRYRNLFPQSFWISVGAFSLASLLGLAWFESNATAACHFSGFCIGTVMGLNINLEKFSRFTSS